MQAHRRQGARLPAHGSTGDGGQAATHPRGPGRHEGRPTGLRRRFAMLSIILILIAVACMMGALSMIRDSV
ncbi:MAG: hypothetical protein IT208_07425 [Chthonomonadales bacterium]|nr:hypothetical protein [Chthonomonadales bacterium]